jgi:hypothetical protein
MEIIDDFVKSIGLAIRAAQDETERFSLELYKNWFIERQDEKTGEITIIPKTLKVAIPKSNGSFENVDIPIIALLNHHSLSLHETKIKISVIPRWDEEQHKFMICLGPVAKDDKNMEGTQDRCEIELIFKKNDNPEGISRYVDKFTKEI